MSDTKQYFVRGWTKRSKTPVFSSMPNTDLAYCCDFARALTMLDQHKSIFSHTSVDAGNYWETLYSFTCEK